MTFRNSIAVAAIALLASAGQARAQLAYALANNGTSLIRFDVNDPGSVTTVGPVSGAVSSLRGLDFRVRDNQIYGVSSSGGQVVVINPETAETSLATTLSTPPSSPGFGIDFNPQVVNMTTGALEDRLRLVGPDDQNLRANIVPGTNTLTDGPLTFRAGDANFGTSPGINEAAYLNNDRDIATTTTLYYLDPTLDILASTAAPNAGQIFTVGSLGVDADEFTGFDIFTSMGTNSAYAILRVGGVSGLYSINLASGAATSIGDLGGGVADVYGLTVVPEPGSVVLLGAGLGLLGLVAARRRRARA